MKFFTRYDDSKKEDVTYAVTYNGSTVVSIINQNTSENIPLHTRTARKIMKGHPQFSVSE